MKDYSVSYARGLAIILMVLGHTMFSQRGNAWISVFDVPLFFFVSGYCFKEKYLTSPLKFILKKIKGIYIPWVKWCAIFVLLHNLFISFGLYNSDVLIGGKTIELYTYYDMLSHIISAIIPMKCNEPLIGGFWFLYDLFWASLIFIVALWVCHKRCYYIGLLFLPLSMFVHYLIGEEHITIYRILQATFMIFCGYYYKNMKNSIRLGNFHLLIAFVLITVGSIYWEGSAHYVSLKHQFPFVLTSLYAIISLLEIFSRCVKYNSSCCLKILDYLGTNSLTILTWHFLCFKVVSLIIVGIYGLPSKEIANFPVIENYSQKGWWIVYLFVSLLICGVISLPNKYIKNTIFKL